ncbi:MAG: transaldolase [Actinomycetota bacterium]|nr:MAG: transaldolase [Actinomycetota bacterium]
MKIFIDSSKLGEIRKAYDYGLLDGVTTNPSLIRAAVEEEKAKGGNIDIEDYIKKILTLARGLPVSLEVIATDSEQMIMEGRRLFKIFNPVADNVYVKIPINPSIEENSNTHFDGLKAIRTLSSDGIPINCTLIFTPEQALLASKAGASFVSPFAGRIDDLIRSQNNITFKKSDYFPASGEEKDGNILEDNGIVSGIDLIVQIREIFDNYGISGTKVLAASIRNARQAREAALAGADIATLPVSVIEELLLHLKTMEGMKGFINDIVPEYRDLLSDDQ